MKAEVSKTVEVVLRMTEVEVKCLREILRCVTVEDRKVALNGNTPVSEYLVDDMDSDMFHDIDSALVGAGLR